MTYDYNIENLIKTFEIHAKMAEDTNVFFIEKYKKNHPEKELPIHLTDPFNISIALSEMCKEIKSLNDWVNDHTQIDN